MITVGILVFQFEKIVIIKLVHCPVLSHSVPEKSIKIHNDCNFHGVVAAKISLS